MSWSFETRPNFGPPLRALSITENGEELFGGTVFTGTESGGTPGANCFNWDTTSTNPVVVGNLAASDGTWTDTGAFYDCRDRARVYCFQLTR